MPHSGIRLIRMPRSGMAAPRSCVVARAMAATCMAVLAAGQHLQGSTRNGTCVCGERWWYPTESLGCLYLSPMQKNWYNASDHCMNLGASLVTVTNETERAYLGSMLSEHTDAPIWWTGAVEIGRKDEWYWTTTLEPVEDSLWAPRNPDEQGHCVNLFWEGETLGFRLNDKPCTNEYPHVCQKPCQ